MSCVRYANPYYRRIYRERPDWFVNHSRYSYLNRAIESCPPWVDRKVLNALHREAARRGMTLDHIIPLTHPRVCGLTVPWNLKIVPLATNMRKGNAWCQWHGDLFTEPEQLRIF